MTADSGTGSWWYRTRGEEFGPVPLETIRELLSSGALQGNDVARQGPAGEWNTLASLLSGQRGGAPAVGAHPQPVVAAEKNESDDEESDAAGRQRSREIARATADSLAKIRSRHGGKSRRPGREAAAQQSPAVGRAIRIGLAAVVEPLRRAIAAAVHPVRRAVGGKTIAAAVLLLVAVGLVLAVRHYWISQTGAYAALNEVWTELKTLRSKNASADEWDRFAGKAQKTSRDITRKLERIADPRDPAALEMFWASRDYLPKMADDSRTQPGLSEQRFAIHMERAKIALWGDPRRRQTRQPVSEPANWIVTAIVAVDVLLVLGAAAWWGRRRINSA